MKDGGLVEVGVQIDPSQKKLTSKSPALLGLIIISTYKKMRPYGFLADCTLFQKQKRYKIIFLENDIFELVVLK